MGVDCTMGIAVEIVASPIEPDKHPSVKVPSPILIASSAVCLLLGIVVLVLALSNQVTQGDVRRLQQVQQARSENLERLRQILAQQEEIQKTERDLKNQDEQISIASQITQKIGPALLQDMALVSLKNNQMKSLLAKHGYVVQPAANANPAP